MSFKIIFYLYLAFNIGSFGKKPKIIGGIITDIIHAPYLASLRYIETNMLFCTGSIISNKHIITAGHCFANKINDLSNIGVFTGTNSMTATDKPIYRIETLNFHPLFKILPLSGNIFVYDIVIVKIVGAIVFDIYQQKINLPVQDVNVDDKAVVLGWGITSHFTIEYSEKLRKASMRILDNYVCSWNHPFKIRNDQLCAFYGVGVGICSGDSGSPLVSNGVLVGVASFGLPCATGVSDIYTRIYYVKDFIEAILSN